MTEMAAPIFELTNLGFAHGEVPVLSDVSLRVERGDYLALVGPNGGGKTTLLRLMIGILHPTSGTIQRHGIAPEDVGYVPQQAAISTGFPITVRDVVLMGALRGGVRQNKPRPQDHDRCDEVLQTLGLTELAARRMEQLSGGERQRVLTARALFSDPEVLVLDEPTSNIDPEGRYCVHELLQNLSGKKTIVLVSHDFSILSTGVTTLAGVNGRVVQSADATLTPEIMALTYGHHGPDCRFGEYLREVSGLHEHEHEHEEDVRRHA